MPSGLRVARPAADELLVNQLVGGRDQEGVGREVVPFGDEVERRAERLDDFEVAERVAPGVPEGRLLLLVEVPEVLVVPEDGRPPRRVARRGSGPRVVLR